MQAQHMVDLATKHSLLQEVEHATHAIEILDLVFTNNCELVSSTVVEDWSTFTDHKLVIIHTNYQYRQLDIVKQKQYLCETGKRYDALDFHKAPWTEVKAELEAVDWGHLKELGNCTTSALAEYHTRVLEVLEKLVPQKKVKTKGKPKMHRMRRLLWKKHSKARKKFRSSNSIHTLSQNLQKMWELEQ